MTTSVLIVPGSLRDAAVTSQIASLTVAVTVAGVTVTLASGLGLMPLTTRTSTLPSRPARARLRTAADLKTAANR